MRLGERGRRDRLGARRGESLFSLIWIEISNKRFRELSVVSFIADPKMNSVSWFIVIRLHIIVMRLDPDREGEGNAPDTLPKCALALVTCSQ